MQTAMPLGDASAGQKPGSVTCCVPLAQTQLSCNSVVLQFRVYSVKSKESLSRATLKPVHQILVCATWMALLLGSQDLEDGALLMARTEGGAPPVKGLLAAHSMTMSGFKCRSESLQPLRMETSTGKIKQPPPCSSLPRGMTYP